MKYKIINSICYVNLQTKSTLGIKKKMLGQARAFSLNGLIAKLICLDGSKLVCIRYENGEQIEKITLKDNIPVAQFFEHLSSLKFLQTSDDAYYIRFIPMANSAITDFISGLSAPDKCVFMEIPTIPYDKELSVKMLASDNYYKSFLKGKVKAFFSPTKPKGMKEYLGTPIFRIRNGIDPTEIPLNNPNIKDNCLRLIGVGWISKWHGFDRIIKSIASQKYLSDGTKVELNIVGTGRAHAELVELCDELGLHEHVFFHGSAEGKLLDDIYGNCHLAVGSLALFRLGLNYAETLKNREYLIRGMPILIAHDDAICGGNYQGVLSVENDDSEIMLEPILQKATEFYESRKSADNRNLATREFSWRNLVIQPLKIING